MNFLRNVIVYLLLFGACSTPAKAENELPIAYQACFREAITELMLTNSTDREALKALFLKHIDINRLGSRTFGGHTWKNASKAWREKAIDMYFDLLFGKGTTLTGGMRDAAATKIEARLADRPEIKESLGSHIVARVILDNGNQFSIAMLVTPACKAFDFAQGDWASRWISAAEVDLAMR